MATSSDVLIQALVNKRTVLRQAKEYAAADEVRQEIEALGYVVEDTADGTTLSPLTNQQARYTPVHKIAVFGSGESSSTGRAIHEFLISSLPTPVSIALLETPTGYEDNPHRWYQNLSSTLIQGLANFHPQIQLIPAFRADTPDGTNDPATLSPLNTCHYIHTGAGSPTYTQRQLQGSLALSILRDRVTAGVPLSLASAAACAFGTFCLPVYELYYAGIDPYWQEGLHFFEDVCGLNITFVPHWNNTEGGEGIDTRFGYMGQRRFTQLLQLLPYPTTIIGIDEHTALIFDLHERMATVMGKGEVTILSNVKKTLSRGSTIPFSLFSTPGVE